MTADQAYALGARRGAADPPLTEEQVTKAALLLAPHQSAGVAARRAS